MSGGDHGDVSTACRFKAFGALRKAAAVAALSWL